MVQESPDLNETWKSAPEFQLLDNENQHEAVNGITANHMAGALYDLIPANPQNTKPYGQWNNVEIKVYEDTVWHIQNGETIVTYVLHTPEWKEMVANSKFPAENPNWVNIANEGYIAFQDHDHDIWFKKIKIKEL